MAVADYVPTGPLLPRNIRGAAGKWTVLKNRWNISENKNERNMYIKQGALRLKVRRSVSLLAQRSCWNYFLQET